MLCTEDKAKEKLRTNRANSTLKYEEQLWQISNKKRRQSKLDLLILVPMRDNIY